MKKSHAENKFQPRKRSWRRKNALPITYANHNGSARTTSGLKPSATQSSPRQSDRIARVPPHNGQAKPVIAHQGQQKPPRALSKASANTRTVNEIKASSKPMACCQPIRQPRRLPKLLLINLAVNTGWNKEVKR